MNNELIGEQIAKFRKAAGMTQEELGKAAGVSTQAVSRWECGGAPDVTLLPAIADKLGVTVDALFGREGGTPRDAAELARSWMASVPKGKRVDRVCRLIWLLAKEMMHSEIRLPEMDYLEKCEYSVEGTGEKVLLRTCINLADGLLFGVGAEDMSFMTVWPKPAAGWGAYLADNECYRTFFTCLARPGCLELLEYLYGVEQHYYVPGVVARETGRPLEETAENMAALEKQGLLTHLDLELETGVVDAYQAHDNGAFVPFLYLARCLALHNDSFMMMWQEDTKPPLCPPEKGEGRV